MDDIFGGAAILFFSLSTDAIWLSSAPQSPRHDDAADAGTHRGGVRLGSERYEKPLYFCHDTYKVSHFLMIDTLICPSSLTKVSAVSRG